MLIRKNSGQAILEYAVLLGVVIAAILVMQTFIKRGYEGSLKDSADKMGDQFSAGGTTTLDKQTMGADQTITNNVNTPGLASGTYSETIREAVPMTSLTESKTDSTTLENTRWTEHQANEEAVTDFPKTW